MAGSPDFPSDRDGADLMTLRHPFIPNSYSHVSQAQIRLHGLTRDQLAMVSVLMSLQASRHPLALQKKIHRLDEVVQSQEIAPAVSLYECARKADGAGAIIVMSEKAAREYSGPRIRITGAGEASGLTVYPKDEEETLQAASSAKEAFRLAYHSAGLSPSEIHYFGLYDCFPICFIRAVEASGLSPPGRGGQWVEDRYRAFIASGGDKPLPPEDLPVNTHGGLLGFAAPWEAPAIFSIIEACSQLSGAAVEGGRQLQKCQRAAVYGNGGVFTHSAVAVLEF
mmetsp:Transcript_27528/g.42985  ORF Transcript_27528/g.42985 Transcript_27528/m.42985 type:complete len:281 (+) Transcript_27528:546-1388(+)